MVTRSSLLANVAGLALAGAMFGGASSAQDYEAKVTAQLNAGQALTPAVNPSDQAAYDAAVEQHQQTQQQYDRQLEDYQARQRAYQQEQQNYRTRVQAYGVQSDIYQKQVERYDADRALNGSVAGVPPVDSGDTVVIDRPDAADTVVVTKTAREFPHRQDRLWDLQRLLDPEHEIGGVPVEDRDGRVVGRFEHLTVQDQGIPKAVIALDSGNRKEVAVFKDHFRYDPDAIVVVSDLTAEELNSMPARY